MKIVAKPVDVIATFTNQKKPVPYKFKFYQESGEKVEITVDKIRCIEESHLAGIDSLVYTCESDFQRERKIYQLKYVIGQYRWELYKI